jgi:hypothetical protein
MLREFPAHPLQLLNDQLRVMRQGCASGCRANPAAMPIQERCAETLFHQPNPLAGRSRRHTRPGGTMRDACTLDHKQEETQIDKIEAQGGFHGAFVPSSLP